MKCLEPSSPVEAIRQEEPDLAKDDIRVLLKRYSPVISRMVVSGEIVRAVDNEMRVFYLSLDWFTVEGIVKANYRHLIDKLRITNLEKIIRHKRLMYAALAA